jgi:homoserine dehydrogenase
LFNYGIRNIKPQDVRYASEKGYRLKLFSRGEKLENKLVGFVAPHFITEENVAYNVNNEFNSVTVEAMFSDKQLFQGKGAGAYPTASAVLSDVSALQFDYSYEYKKSNNTENIAFSNDIELKIYAGASTLAALDIFEWIEKEETFQGKDYAYITGIVNLNKIAGIDFNKEFDLFFAVLPK